MNRFKLLQSHNIRNSIAYKNTVYPIIEQEANDTYIISSTADRLDILAKKYYNDDTLYWVIGRCNGIYNSLYLDSGIQLCIPNKLRLPSIINKYQDINE